MDNLLKTLLAIYPDLFSANARLNNGNVRLLAGSISISMLV